MNLNIKYCNNIEKAEISIAENQLNIKYAINGTGKTTISQAISSYINDKQNNTNSIRQLKPFKHLDKDDHEPEITGAEHINSVKVFDENYLNNYLFLPNELLKGSFDVFIRDENYENGLKDIDNLVRNLKDMLAEDKDIDDLLVDFNALSSSFGAPIKQGIHGSSRIMKAFKSGNKIVNIPEGLEGYKDYIQNENNYKWVKWQIDGKAYLDVSDNCPYCTNNIGDKKARIKRVGEVYDSKSIENLNIIVSTFQRLNQYFSDETKSMIEKFVTNIDGYTDDQIIYLREIRGQIDQLSNKFLMAQKIGFKSFKDVDKVIEGLKSHYIDLGLFNHLQSDATSKKVDIVNNSLNSLLEKAGELQGSITKQKLLIEKLVKENRNEINSFLQNAGYLYHVDLIEDENGDPQLKLIHNDITETINNVKTHLSFGERNAFSLILFMYDVIKNKPDLIILDDPVSSFDKNKKYAIVDFLFRRERCFRGKTVLLLTHDFDPIIDIVHHHTDKFLPPHAVLIENTKGILSENIIKKTDIKTFAEINNENINSECHMVNKAVYLRRLYELTNEKGFGYQLISNLLHKRDKPTFKEIEERLMSVEEINAGIDEIRTKILDFDYQECVKILKDDSEMKKIYFATTSNYEKLHIYRIILIDKKQLADSDIIIKFINEASHIENDYIYQLNPRNYQLIPQYVIDECDKYVSSL